MHMLLHLPKHCDDSPNSIHILQQQYAVDGSLSNGKFCVKLQACRKTHSQDSPSDRRGIRPSDSLHQKACYEQRAVSPLSEVQSEPILRE